MTEPTVGAEYVCAASAPRGWVDERVIVTGVSREQRTARVCDAEGYETVVSWDDLRRTWREGR